MTFVPFWEISDVAVGGWLFWFAALFRGAVQSIMGIRDPRQRLEVQQIACLLIMAPAATNSLNDADANRDRPVRSIPIAIVGMACRFGGDVTNPSKLWDLCVSGRDGWTPIPKDRFDVKALYHKDRARLGRNHVEGGYFMKEDISLFDAAFFNLASDVASVSPSIWSDESTKQKSV